VGLTGTAKTEEGEFFEIYKMPVVVVPTNRPVVRQDAPDMVFNTQEAKYRGIVSEIINMFVRGQPVLVGTRSVEVSEYISGLLAPDKLRLHCLILVCQQKLFSGSDLKKGDRNEALESLRPNINTVDRRMVADLARQLGLNPDPATPENLEAILQHPGVQVAASGGMTDPEQQERLAAALKEGIPHSVLNAKQHEHEGKIIAEAGAPGQVTIATNMAGRGVDIVLGGKTLDQRTADPERAGRVREAGGLHILGTERHESRRIDNQLRGRSGRQGDPGSSRFYVSLEDELMRLFAPERFGFMMRGWPEEEVLEHKLVSRSLETAQHKVEMRNFEVRKDTLKYDDVMNKQRGVIYADRRRVLLGEDFHENVKEMFDQVVASEVSRYASPEINFRDWDLEGLHAALQEAIPHLEHALTLEELPALEPRNLGEEVQERVRGLVEERTVHLGAELLRDIERSWLLRIIDIRWMEHLQEMDYMRDSIHLRAYGQRDPLVEYQREAFN
jgi:preprotein translocase subunit SecA